MVEVTSSLKVFIIIDPAHNLRFDKIILYMLNDQDNQVLGLISLKYSFFCLE